MHSRFRVASAGYAFEELGTYGEYEQKTARLVEEAADESADILLFPEYGSFELVCPANAPRRPLAEQLDAVQAFSKDFKALFADLAQRHKKVIVAPTFPVPSRWGYVNRAYVFAPHGVSGYQDKLIMTDYERSEGLIVPGYDQNVFYTEHGPFGVVICYDIEFPMPSRLLCHEGAKLLLVPACTDTDAGASRVKTAAKARALENQCYVVTSHTQGTATFSEAIDVNTGRQGAYCPPDTGLSSNGVMAQGRDVYESNWLTVNLDTRLLYELREVGQVQVPLHWDEQPTAIPSIIDLTNK